MNATGGETSEELLLQTYVLYDRYVDIVSAFHWLFTEVEGMRETVRRFDRYPRVTLSDGREVTPDFAVLFSDGRAYIAEIANIPLHDNGFDGLAKQLLAYDEIATLMDADGTEVVLTSCDVVLITRFGDGTDAHNRLQTRLHDLEHPYKPKSLPVVLQYAHESDRYTFARLPIEGNPRLTPAAEGRDFGEFADLKVKPGRFARVKAQHAFMNDPIDALYLATFLWSKVFPSVHGVDDFETTAIDIAKTLRRQYGVGRVTDAEHAMDLLVRAGLATQIKGKSKRWTVRRRAMRTAGEDVHERIAKRVGPALDKSRAVAESKSRRKEMEGQGALF